jgi:hypothetical protein
LDESENINPLDYFLERADLQFSQKSAEEAIPIMEWCLGLNLGGRPFQLEKHEYEKAMLEEEAPRQCFKKGAQMGITETQILKTMHGLIYSRYSQGVLYLFPSVVDVQDFSKGRFGPLLSENEEISEHVSNTDSVSVKRVRKAMLYLRGARATGKIEGIKRTSSQLKSVPVDRVVFDEVDEMEAAMVDLALERMSHSTVKEEAYLSTPSVPSWGIDRLYNDSNQQVWMIRCDACGTETCLELEFPNCLLEMQDGRVIRSCKKCKREIFPKDGHWVAQYPDRSKDMVGFWISQLCSAYVSPPRILQLFNDPPNGNLAEVYNSKLAMAYISAENRLTINDVYSCCGQDAQAMNHKGPCAMGVDVGAMLHVVVGFKPKDKQLQIIHLARLSSFNDVHDLAQRFNVKCAVIDMEPELRKAREFAQSQPYPVFLCDYQDHIVSGPQWDEERRLVKVNRTETCDATHDLVSSSGLLILPRRSEELEIFAKQTCNIAKVLEEDQETGSRQYRYRKLGEDHYRHALNYFWLASKRIWVCEQDTPEKALLRILQKRQQDNYDPLTFGLHGAQDDDNNPLTFGQDGIKKW